MKGILFKKRLWISCTLRVMNQECQIQVIIIKPRITVAFVRVYHVRYFFCKKGNYFWGLCFRRVVIFGGSLLSGFANTCDILSLVSEVGLLLSWIPAWSSAPFEGSLLSQLYCKWQTCRGLPKTHYDIPPNIRRLCRKALVPSPHLLLVSMRFRFWWAFEVSIWWWNRKWCCLHYSAFCPL